jgi:hypothetical protein
LHSHAKISILVNRQEAQGPGTQLTGVDRGKTPDFEMSLPVPSGYAWQYIFAIVAFSNKLF